MWTPAERRGAALVACLLALGAARDLWRAAFPGRTPPAPRAAVVEAAPDPAAPPPAQSAPPAPRPARATDLNRATAAELDALPGIGPVLAGRILEHRRAHGPFGSVDDLLAVRGVGPRLLERLRPLVRASSGAGTNAGP